MSKALKPEALSVRLGQYRITDLTGASIQRVSAQDKHNALSDRQSQIADLVLQSNAISSPRCGLDYPGLDPCNDSFWWRQQSD